MKTNIEKVNLVFLRETCGSDSSHAHGYGQGRLDRLPATPPPGLGVFEAAVVLRGGSIVLAVLPAAAVAVAAA